MKKIICGILIFVPAFFACKKNIEKENQVLKGSTIARQVAQKAGGLYYYYKGQKQLLELNTDYMFATTTNSLLVQKGMNIEGKTVIKVGRDNRLRKVNNRQEEVYWAELKLTPNLNEKDYLRLLREFRNKQDVETVSPFFKTETISKIRLSNGFYVKLKSGKDFSTLKSLADSNDVVILGENKFMPLWYTLSVTKNSMKNALEMANFFYETGLFDHAEPDLLADNLGASPSDLLYPDQWNLLNIGQYGGTSGIDIKLEGAHAITKGSGVIVAIIDEGVQLNHPDLVNNIYNYSYDAMTGTSPSLVYGGHGTACAGIVAADDNTIGVLGIAPDSKIMSTSVDWRNGTYVQERLADAINWSWQHGADIISFSLSGGTPSAYLNAAISKALTFGRDGRGCVVTMAVGNGNNNLVAYPASIYPDILAVGAMSYCDQRKSWTSCDGVTSWGSNYGTNLDIVAPGIRIPTTYVPGTGDGGSDYSTWFYGTSSATPHVAGVAALLLAAYPNLTQKEISSIIELTAQKIGTYSYSNYTGRPNGTWNQEVGHGLLDAAAAVTSANSVCSLTSWVGFQNLRMETNGTLHTMSIDFTGSGAYTLEYSIYGNGPLYGLITSGTIHNIKSGYTYYVPENIPYGHYPMYYVFDCVFKNSCGEDVSDPIEVEFEFVE